MLLVLPERIHTVVLQTGAVCMKHLLRCEGLQDRAMSTLRIPPTPCL